MPDTIKIKILADGTIRVETDTISDANHLSAEGFVRLLAERAGGNVQVTSKHPEHEHGQGEGQHQH